MGFSAVSALGAPAPIAVIDTEAVLRADLLPGSELAGGPLGADPRSHGSLMTMAIAGPEGIAPGAKVLHYSCPSAGSIEGACALSSLENAIARDVRVISLSWSVQMSQVGADYQAAFSSAVARARANGIIVFAAAFSGGPTFPADIAGVVSVGAREPEGGLPDPGDNAQIRLSVQNTYGFDGHGVRFVRGGSSFATAEAAARAALTLGSDPNAPLDTLPGTVEAADRAAIRSATSSSARSFEDGSTIGSATPRSARTPAARALTRAQIKRATKLSAVWRGELLILRGRAPKGASVEVLWKRTRFACAAGKLPCRLHLIGGKTRTVRVIVRSGRSSLALNVRVR